jgi:hypothetical protein
VERASLNVPATLTDQADDPVAELRGGLVREGDGQDAERWDVLDADEVGDPVRQDSRLTRPRAGQDE